MCCLGKSQDLIPGENSRKMVWDVQELWCETPDRDIGGSKPRCMGQENALRSVLYSRGGDAASARADLVYSRCVWVALLGDALPWTPNDAHPRSAPRN